MKATGNKKMTLNNKSGFAMLFAVLASSLLMAIGISMFNISIKEIQIATSERDSQIAYYAADSARECAIYSDVKQGPLLTCDPADQTTTPCPSPAQATITCNGTSTTLLFNRSGSGSPTFTYNLSPASPTIFFRYSTTSIAEPEGGASIIQKIFSAGGGSLNTISAFGHNTGIIGRRVERSVSNQY
jgi:hypothetical protein